MRVTVAVTGASGVIYGKRLLEALKGRAEVYLVVSEAAEQVVAHELPGVDLAALANVAYKPSNLTASIASGSFKIDAMIVAPCTMKTVGALASGHCDDLISRAADVQLKEGRKLILVPRETPLHAIHLENLTKLARLGAVILPAMPAFYSGPESVEDLVDFIVGKILDQLGVDHSLFQRWGS